MRIDSHQHFWDIDRFQYPWMAADSPLRRNYLPEYLEPILQRAHFDGSVVVQANIIPDETRWLLQLATEHAFILAVVGWADLTDPRLGDLLDEYQKHPKFKGIRHLVHDEPDVNWLLREDVLRGLRELARRGIPYDLLVRPAHLKLVPELAERVPDLRMVIDHLAKPPIKQQVLEGWAQDIEAASRIAQVFCKISGMVTEADWSNGNAAHLRPYVAHAMRCFGLDRIMFGSDWPVCRLVARWKEVLAAFTQAIGPLPLEAREKVLGDTAARFYGLL